MITFLLKAKQTQSDKKDGVALLISRLKGFDKERSHKQVHVSDLTKEEEFCPRQFALYDILKRTPKDVHISAALRVAFDQGKSLHDMCREKWLANDVVGHWQCQACKKIVYFCKQPSGGCQKCGAKVWKYKECEFVYAAAGVSGSIDFLIDFNVGKHTIYEAKSMDKDIFASLKAPLAEHGIRIICYLYSIARCDSPYKNRIDLSEGRILYISKAYGTKSMDHKTIVPFREFVVKRNDEVAAPYFAPAIELYKFRQGGKIPNRICPTPVCNRAQRCNVQKECFSGAY